MKDLGSGVGFVVPGGEDSFPLGEGQWALESGRLRAALLDHAAALRG